MSRTSATSPRSGFAATEASRPAILLDRLTKTFNATPAVDRLTLTVDRGSVCGLLGGNGAGKTTTIGMIMGLILPTSGRVEVLGTDMARDRHRVLGRMNFESPYVDMPHRLTVRQNLDVFARLYGIPGRRPAAPSPRRCSTDPTFCCSTSRRRLSIPTPPIGSAP